MRKIRAVYDKLVALGCIAAALACFANVWSGSTGGMLAAMIAFTGLFLLACGLFSLFVRRPRDDGFDDGGRSPGESFDDGD